MDTNLSTVEVSTALNPQSSSTLEQPNNVAILTPLKTNLSPNSNQTSAITNLQAQDATDRLSVNSTTPLNSLQSSQQLTSLATQQQLSSRPQSQQPSFQQPTILHSNSLNALEMAPQQIGANMPFGNSELFENAQNTFSNKQSPNTIVAPNKNALNTTQRKSDQQMFRGPGEHPMGSSHVKQQQKSKAKKEVYRFTNREPLYAANWSNNVDFRLIASTVLNGEEIVNNKVILNILS